jgi:hypothetical protein
MRLFGTLGRMYSPFQDSATSYSLSRASLKCIAVTKIPYQLKNQDLWGRSFHTIHDSFTLYDQLMQRDRARQAIGHYIAGQRQKPPRWSHRHMLYVKPLAALV